MFAAKKIWNILTSAITVIVAVIALFFIFSRLFGIQIYTVLSGSMEPEYHTGSVIFVKPMSAENVKENDVITFRLTDSTNATHRIVRIDNENKCFYTKGDNNEYEDVEPVAFSALIGVPVFTIPLVGYAVELLKSPIGPLLIAFIIVVNIIISGKKKVNDKDEKEDNI